MNLPGKFEPDVGYELYFQSSLRAGSGWSFPCDADGHVDMNAMTERVRNNYLFARALVAIDFHVPQVRTI